MIRFALASALILALGAPLFSAPPQDEGKAGIHIPDSSLEGPTDQGARAHTNHVIHLGHSGAGGGGGSAFQPPGMHPDQIRNAYGVPSSGGAGAVIAIVDAYHYSSAQFDFNMFSHQFGLSQELSGDITSASNQVLQVVYQGGIRPPRNTGWSQEAALDIQWAHAMAPQAKIILVEAQSNSFANLLAAVDQAVGLRTAPSPQNVVAVSMSWGGSEFSSESQSDSHFNASRGPLFFAASGDTGGLVIWPSASPYVVAAGGTTLTPNGAGGFTETGWSSGGGGSSAYEAPLPSWQTGVANLGPNRSVPDIACDSDPNTGVAVYAPVNSRSSGWLVFGGTSVASPCLTGMVVTGGYSYSNTTDLLGYLYKNLGSAYFRDITDGNNGHPCLTGWDFVTGVGSPQGVLGFR
jgi:subtilase family serine protease